MHKGSCRMKLVYFIVFFFLAGRCDFSLKSENIIGCDQNIQGRNFYFGRNVIFIFFYKKVLHCWSFIKRISLREDYRIQWFKNDRQSLDSLPLFRLPGPFFYYHFGILYRAFIFLNGRSISHLYIQARVWFLNFTGYHKTPLTVPMVTFRPWQAYF